MAEYQNTDGGRGPLKTSVILAIALALVLAAHEVNWLPGWSLLGVYVYWIARIGMDFLVIIGAYVLLGQVMSGRSSPIAHAGLATALSFPPFVMVVTTFDLLIGDLGLLRTDPNALIRKLGIDAASLIDNHLTTCALLLAPFVLHALRPAPRRVAVALPDRGREERRAAAADAFDDEDDSPQPEPEMPGLLLASQPPVQGELLAAEAQEHYVKLKATGQGGMSLYRFGDAVRDLSRYQGMQVHRSHWISDKAVKAVIGKRGAMRIELSSGEVIPVSRRYELEVEARYANRERRAE